MPSQWRSCQVAGISPPWPAQPGANGRGDAAWVRNQQHTTECRGIFPSQRSMGKFWHRGLRNLCHRHYCLGRHHMLLAPGKGPASLQAPALSALVRCHLCNRARPALFPLPSAWAARDTRSLCLRSCQVVQNSFRMGQCPRGLLALPRGCAAPASVSLVPTHRPWLWNGTARIPGLSHSPDRLQRAWSRPILSPASGFPQLPVCRAYGRAIASCAAAESGLTLSDSSLYPGPGLSFRLQVFLPYSFLHRPVWIRVQWRSRRGCLAVYPQNPVQEEDDRGLFGWVALFKSQRTIFFLHTVWKTIKTQLSIVLQAVCTEWKCFWVNSLCLRYMFIFINILLYCLFF